MASGHQHPDQGFSDLSLGNEHIEYLMSEDLRETLAHDDGSNLESARAAETAIGRKNVPGRIDTKMLSTI